MNAKDIPNGYRARELFEMFLSVLDSVTDFVTQRSCGAFALEHDWRREATRATAKPAQVGMETLYQLSSLWTEATTASNTLCAGLAVHDFGLEDLFARLDRFAGNKPALESLIHFHEQIFLDIDGTQLPLVAQELLTEAVGAMRRWQEMGMAGVRMPVLLRERFEPVTRSMPLESFVAHLAYGDGAADAMELQRSMTKDWKRYKVLFFAGAIAAIADNFERAARHLTHATQLLKDQAPAQAPSPARLREDALEIAYLSSVVDRLRMRDAKTFERAARRLAKQVDEVPEGSFEHARAVSEGASLHLMRYFNIRFGIETGAEPDTAARMLTRARHMLGVAESLLPRVRKRKSVERALLTGLQAQVYANMICWHVAHSGFFEGREAQLDADAAASLDTLTSLRGMSPGDDYIVGLWDGVATWLMAPPATRNVMAAEVARFCRKRLRALTTIGADYQTPVDALVFEYVAARAESG